MKVFNGIASFVASITAAVFMVCTLVALLNGELYMMCMGIFLFVLSAGIAEDLLEMGEDHE